MADEQTALVTRIEAEISDLPAVAESMVIDSPESYAAAGEMVKSWGERIDSIREKLDPMRKAAHAAWQQAIKLIDQAVSPAETARKIVGGKMADWDREQERVRREAAAAAEAERRRQEHEAAERNAAAREAARAGDIDRAREERAAATAANLAAAAVMAKTAPAPKVSGLTMRSTWTAEVTDFRALVRAVAAEPLLLGLLQPNLEALHAEARQAKSPDLGIPGVRGVESRRPARTGR